MKPLTISVITPSYNQGQYLGATMESVISQDYPHVEYLVMDGGSTDESTTLIRKNRDRIAGWCIEKDEGQSDAIAKGFERSTGDILCWLNSDDLLLPGALTEVARFFRENPEVEVVSGGAYCIDTEGKPIRKLGHNHTLGVAATYGRFRYYEMDGVWQVATFWRRSAYFAVGGIDRSLDFIMDFDLFLRLAKRRRFARLPKMLACFRVHAESKTACIQHVRHEENRVFRKRYGANRYGSLVSRLLFYRYRFPSLVQKAWLGVLLSCRIIELKRVP